MTGLYCSEQYVDLVEYRMSSIDTATAVQYSIRRFGYYP